MSNYNGIRGTIDANIRENGLQEISGEVLNVVLNAMVDVLGKNYQFAGVASVDGNPGQPEQNVFYIANLPGTYTNFGGLVVEDGEIAILKWNGAWSKTALFQVAGDNILISEPYFPVNEHTESELTIAPNIYHKWGEVTSLTISLAAPTDDSVTNEYIIEFTSGSTAPTITLPDSLLFAGALELEANAVYQISIINNLVVWSAFKEA